jgi:hypothetical protein
VSQEYRYKDQSKFLHKLEALVGEGVATQAITVVSPYHVHEVDEILDVRPSRLKFFTFFGALSGTITGFAFTIYTVLRWPFLITGGKPLVSIPPFIIIAFELTILFGVISTFLGFLILSKLASPKRIISPIECENDFMIIVNGGDAT